MATQCGHHSRSAMSHHVLGHQTVPIRGSWCLRFTGSGRLTSAAVQAAGQLKTTDCAQIALLAAGFLAKKSVSLYDSHFVCSGLCCLSSGLCCLCSGLCWLHRRP